MGNGTTPELYLPLATGDQYVRPAAEMAPALSASGALRVLAVDDDPLGLMNSVMMLEDLGHSVTDATSAQKALDLIASAGGFDMVVTDHSMPGMTGSELTRQLREVHCELPIILASGYTDLPLEVWQTWFG